LTEWKSYEESIPDNAKAISEYTFQVFERKWFDNLAVNLPLIREERDVKELEKHTGKPAVVVASGPSVDRFNHLDLLREYQDDFVIFACDSALCKCLRKGVVPHYVVSVDGSDRVAEFYTGVLTSGVKYVLSVFVSPRAVELLPKERYWFIPPVDDPFAEKSLTRAVYWMTGEKTILVSLVTLEVWHGT